MRLLVIGASGFLGAHVRHEAETIGMEVVTAARSALPGSPHHVLVDVASDDPLRLARVLEEVAADVVVNCAGAVSGPAEVLAAINVTGTYRLVLALTRMANPARLVHLGSAAEYGRAEPGVAVAEGVPALPVGMYGLTKLAGTRLVELARFGGLDSVVLRVFNPIGPGAPAAGLPGRLAGQLRRAIADGTDVCLGPLDAVRDFVDVRDVADAVIAAAAVSTVAHPVLNIGRGQGVSARELVKELVSISGYTGRVREDSAGSERSADVAWQEADISMARADLGWRPRRELASSLVDLWEAQR